MKHSPERTETVEFTLVELMNYLVGKCQEVGEPSQFGFPITYSYLCHVAEHMVRDRCEFFNEHDFSKQLSDMFPDEILDKEQFIQGRNGFGIEECISQEDMFKFYKRGCEIYGKPISPHLDISWYNSYAYNHVPAGDINVTVFHRTMAKIGMLDMLVQRNPDAVFVVECDGYSN